VDDARRCQNRDCGAPETLARPAPSPDLVRRHRPPKIRERRCARASAATGRPLRAA
jgi:hypothetical protein